LDSIRDALKHLPDSEERWRIIQNDGEIHEITNRGSKLYMGMAGIGLSEALTVLDLTTVRGSLPEPLRVAHLIASGITDLARDF